MEISDLKKLESAPASGWLLAYTRKKVIFQPYQDLEAAKAAVMGQELLELHLFDRDKEYRSVMSRSLRYAGGVIEAVVDFPEGDKQSTYGETVCLEDCVGGGKITILNHLNYSDINGMMTVDNYRLRMEGQNG